MIIDRSTVRTSWFGLSGYNQTTDPDYPELVPSLLTSRTGRKINGVHALLSDVENIHQSIKNFSEYDYPAYAADEENTQGKKVSFGGVNYEYINPVATTGTPPPNAEYWEVINELSDYLIKVDYAATDQMLDDWINAKKIRTKIKSIYSNVLLYNGVANYRDLVPNAGNFVGIRFRMKKGERSLAIILNKLGYQFSAAFNGLTVYLYHSSQQAAVTSFQVNQTAAKSSQWHSLTQNNILRYLSDNHDAGGDFYLGYFQDDLQALGAQALKMDLNWHESPCDCDSRWSDWYQQYTPFVDVVGFEVDADSFGEGRTLFDPDDVGISLTNNYGLNVNMTAKCDIGYFLSQEEDLFAEAKTLAVAKKLLEGIAYNIRGGNQVANQLRAEAKKELYHSTGVWGTVFDRYTAAIKALSFDLSGLGEHCFPCDEGEGSEDVIIGVATLR